MKKVLLTSVAIIGLAGAAAACGSYDPCDGDGGTYSPTTMLKGGFLSDVIAYGGANGIGNLRNESYAETFTKAEQLIETVQTGDTCDDGCPANGTSYKVTNLIQAGSLAINVAESDDDGGASSLSNSRLEGFFKSGLAAMAGN